MDPRVAQWHGLLHQNTGQHLGVKPQQPLTQPQVPLLLAWALTIHKAQGQTLTWVQAHLGRVFLPGNPNSNLPRNLL